MRLKIYLVVIIFFSLSKFIFVLFFPSLLTLYTKLNLKWSPIKKHSTHFYLFFIVSRVSTIRCKLQSHFITKMYFHILFLPIHNNVYKPRRKKKDIVHKSNIEYKPKRWKTRKEFPRPPPATVGFSWLAVNFRALGLASKWVRVDEAPTATTSLSHAAARPRHAGRIDRSPGWLACLRLSAERLGFQIKSRARLIRHSDVWITVRCC